MLNGESGFIKGIDGDAKCRDVHPKQDYRPIILKDGLTHQR